MSRKHNGAKYTFALSARERERMRKRAVKQLRDARLILRRMEQFVRSGGAA